MDIDGLIKDFLVSENLSKSSKPIYENVLMVFGAFIRRNDLKFENLTDVDIFKSLDDYIVDRNIKYENTARLYISAVKEFFIFCDQKNTIKNKDLSGIFGYGNNTEGFEDKVNIKINSLISNKTISREKTGEEIDSDELETLVKECDIIIKNFKIEDLNANKTNGKYTRYISALGVKILAYTGIKVGLLLDLNIECISSESCLEVKNLKKKKCFSIQIPETLYNQLIFYRDEIRNRLIQLKKSDSQIDYLLIDFNGKEMSNKPFNELIFELIGSGKKMGHATAIISKRAIIDMMTAGMSVKIIQDLTGYGEKVLDYCKEKADEIKKEEKNPNQYVNKYLDKRSDENNYYRSIFNIKINVNTESHNF